MKNILKSALFWILLVIITLAVFVFGANANKTFVGKTRILFLPKSAVTARNIDQVIGNAQEIPRSLSFYNKMIELNVDIEDEAKNMPDAERKNFWNGMLEIQRIGQSGILEIGVKNKNQWQAEILSKQVKDSLLTVMSRYYNISTDLDMRVIDGPIIETIGISSSLWALISILIGAIVAGIISLIFSNISERLPKVRPEIPFSFSMPKEKEYKIPAKKSSEEKVEEKIITSAEKKSAAPSNLPVGEDFVLFKTKEEEPVVEEPKQTIHREATAEEVKARLNRLLQGKM